MTIYVALNKFKHGIMYCIGYLQCILLYQNIEQYECRKCKIADEEGDLGILYPPALKKGAVVHFGSDSEVERSTVDCCGRYIVSIAYAFEKQRAVKLPMDRVDAGTAPEILPVDGSGRSVSEGTGAFVARAERYD